MARKPINLNQLEIRLLADTDEKDFSTFSSGDSDLDDFLCSDARRLGVRNVARTFVVRYENNLAGYTSLMADAIVLETKERKRLYLTSGDHPVIPAVKIARLAVAELFRTSYRGLGQLLVRFAASIALDFSETVGCRLLTVDAYPQSVAFYERLGFVRNRAKQYRDREHPSMRFDLHAPKLPAWIAEG